MLLHDSTVPSTATCFRGSFKQTKLPLQTNLLLYRMLTVPCSGIAVHVFLTLPGRQARTRCQTPRPRRKQSSKCAVSDQRHAGTLCEVSGTTAYLNR